VSEMLHAGAGEVVLEGSGGAWMCRELAAVTKSAVTVSVEFSGAVFLDVEDRSGRSLSVFGLFASGSDFSSSTSRVFRFRL
jgi:hypothetical protein